MLLSRIVTDPARFQKRDHAYSIATVEAICKEGIKTSKFDPIPLVDQGDGTYVVGGDGHSRFEATTRLHRALKLPKEWKRDDDWDVPHKIVDLDEAQKLAWTANFCKKTFEAVEEAKVFQEMLDSGMDMARVANECHVSESYVREALPLNILARDIRERESARRTIAAAKANRVGRLKGYGNAIVPEVAAEFIRAYIDIHATSP